jgi:hypothetical protein
MFATYHLYSHSFKMSSTSFTLNIMGLPGSGKKSFVEAQKLAEDRFRMSINSPPSECDCILYMIDIQLWALGSVVDSEIENVKKIRRENPKIPIFIVTPFLDTGLLHDGSMQKLLNLRKYEKIQHFGVSSKDKLGLEAPLLALEKVL